jgi:quinohemoprotein ethanol dehydrogenase
MNFSKGSRSVLRCLILAAVLVSAQILARASASPIDGTDTRFSKADQEPHNWLTTGRDSYEQHYSPLDQINEESIARLGFAWQYDASSRRGRVQHPLEATPLVVDGVMYASGAWGSVFALDAVTGRELWRFEPEVEGGRARLACCNPVNRGVAVSNGKVYVGQFDGWLVALAAATGRVVWKVDTVIDRRLAYTITGAPRVIGDSVVIGNGGNEFGVRGYVTAYDLKTGAQRWRFFTVPGDPKKGYENPDVRMAARTWDPGRNWDAAGGGAPWDGMAYDPKLNLLYVGTGNGFPGPVWLRSRNRTENLFLASILAIHTDTGRLAWYYQATPGESWDYDATQPLILADLTLGGKERALLMQADRNGFFYVLDRRTGKLLAAKNYTRVTWASSIDLATGRPRVTGQGAYSKKPTLVAPSPWGGHTWHPMAYSPLTRMVYFPSLEIPVVFKTHPDWHYRPNGFDWGAGYDFSTEESTVQLLAWDPVTQRTVWRAPVEGGGVLATAGGLVFQGTADGHLRAYRAGDGKLLKEIFVGTGIIAAPMSYATNGVQYVAVMAGDGGYLHGDQGDYSNRGRILAFRLGGGATPLPEGAPTEALQPLPPRPQVSAGILQKGERLFIAQCGRCHDGGLSPERSPFPNLFNLRPATHEIFDQIVLDGIYGNLGMASFSDLLGKDDVHAVHDWLIDAAYRQRAGEPVTHMHVLQ